MKKCVLLTPKGRRTLASLQASDEQAAHASPSLDTEQMTQRITPPAGQEGSVEEMKEKRRRWERRTRGEAGAVFLSYDVPLEWNHRRDWLRRRLGELGFEKFHQSFYLGGQRLLRKIVEEAEAWGLVPYLCWGRVHVLPG